jgi:hypothetical protein
VWKIHVGRKAATGKNVTDEKYYILALNNIMYSSRCTVTFQKTVTAVKTSN